MKASRRHTASPGTFWLGAVASLTLVAVVGIAGAVMTIECTTGGSTGSGCFSAPQPLSAVADVVETTSPQADAAQQPDISGDETSAVASAEAPFTPAQPSSPTDLVVAATFDSLKPAPSARRPAQVAVMPPARSNAASQAIARETGADDRPGSVLAYAPPPPSRQSRQPDAVSIGSSSVNVRASASISSKRLFVLPAGTPVTAKDARDGWVQIASADGRTGWVDADYLSNFDTGALPAKATASAKPDKVAPAKAEAKVATRTVGRQGVNVRARPSKTGSKLFALAPGAEVKVTDDEKGWLRVVDSKGRSGWVYKTYVK